jgi:CRISPR-associated protein Cmr4
MAIRMMFVHALTSLHVGTGQGVGAIDLPIARERATDLPLVPGSSIKGCLKDRRGAGNEDLFGKEDSAGLLQISDARLLLLPLRCLGATFVWATSPYVLRRLQRDADSAAVAGHGFPAITDIPDGQARVASPDSLIEIGGQRKLVLEELDFTATVDAKEWSDWIGSRLFPADRDWQQEFGKRFAIIDDKSFTHLARFGTEVNAHVRISNETGTVEAGALWYQESLPAETVLVSLFRTEARNGGGGGADAKLAAIAGEQVLQMGGKATTGQGMVRLAPAGGQR